MNALPVTFRVYPPNTKINRNPFSSFADVTDRQTDATSYFRHYIVALCSSGAQRRHLAQSGSQPHDPSAWSESPAEDVLLTGGQTQTVRYYSSLPWTPAVRHNPGEFGAAASWFTSSCGIFQQYNSLHIFRNCNSKAK